MGKTMSVQSEIKVVVAAAMPLRLWPCLRLVFESCQMQLKHQCSRLKILSAVVNMHKVVKEVCLQCFVQLINKNYWSAAMHRRKCVRNLKKRGMRNYAPDTMQALSSILYTLSLVCLFFIMFSINFLR